MENKVVHFKAVFKGRLTNITAMSGRDDVRNMPMRPVVSHPSMLSLLDAENPNALLASDNGPVMTMSSSMPPNNTFKWSMLFQSNTYTKERILMLIQEEWRHNKVKDVVILLALLMILALAVLDVAVILSHFITFPSPRGPGAVVDHTPGTITLVESIPDEVNLETAVHTGDAWVTLINGATRTLDIACFYMTLHNNPPSQPTQPQGEAVFQAILNAIDRGVVVRVVANKPSGTLPKSPDLDTLAEAGASVHMLDVTKFAGGILHTKFIVADHARFYLGSANMDWRSLQQVKEAGVVVDNPVLAEDLGKIFTIYHYAAVHGHLASWAGEATRMNMTQPGLVRLNHTESQVCLSVAPPAFVAPGREEDIAALTHTIRTADDFVWISVMDYAPYIQGYDRGPNVYWPVIDTALRKAASISNGIDGTKSTSVKLLVSYWEHTAPLVQEAAASLAMVENVEVRWFKVPPLAQPLPFATDHTRVNHAKYMVTEDRVFITTSNWLGNYYVDTAGVSLVTDHAALRTQVMDSFMRDWDSEYTHTVDELIDIHWDKANYVKPDGT